MTARRKIIAAAIKKGAMFFIVITAIASPGEEKQEKKNRSSCFDVTLFTLGFRLFFYSAANKQEVQRHCVCEACRFLSFSF